MTNLCATSGVPLSATNRALGMRTSLPRTSGGRPLGQQQSVSNQYDKLDWRKRELQRKRQLAVDKGKSTMLFDKLISAVQRKMNEGTAA